MFPTMLLVESLYLAFNFLNCKVAVKVVLLEFTFKVIV